MSRRGPVKKGLSAAESTSRRREDAGRLRRAQRAGRLSSKRRVLMDSELNNSVEWTPEEVQAVLRDLQGSARSDPNRLTRGLAALHRILTCESKDPPLEQVAASGVLNLLQELVANAESGAKPSDDGASTLQLQALHCVANLATGDTGLHRGLAAGLVELIPHLVMLIESPSVPILEAAVWTIGNLAGEVSPAEDPALDIRKRLHDGGAVAAVASRLTRGTLDAAGGNGPSLATFYWALGNLARDRESPASYVVAQLTQGNQLLPIAHLRECIGNIALAHVRAIASEICWLLTFLSAKELETVEALLGVGLAEVVVSLLGSLLNGGTGAEESMAVSVPALRVCGNILAGPDSWTRAVLQNEGRVNFASVLTWALRTGAGALTVEALWVMGNLCLFRDPALTPVLVELADKGAFGHVLDFFVGAGDGLWRTASIEREAILVFRNLAVNSAVPQDLILGLICSRNGGRDVVSSWAGRLRGTNDIEMLHMCVFLLHFAVEKVPEAIEWAVEESFAVPLDDLHYDPRLPPELQREAGRLAELIYEHEEQRNDAPFASGEEQFTFAVPQAEGAFNFPIGLTSESGAPETGHPPAPMNAEMPRATDGRGRGIDNRPAWMMNAASQDSSGRTAEPS